jgi:hypothetical protein
MSVPVETAFFVAKRTNGTYFVTTNLNTEFDVDHTATNLDVKLGCSELLDVLKNDELVNLFLARLAANSQTESEKATSSIRQALSDKGIL